MKRTPIAHIIFPRPNLERPVPEFAWEAVRALHHTKDLDVTVYVPIPVGPLKALSSARRRRLGAPAWPEGLDVALRRLEPRPQLVPYIPIPRRSTEAAAAAVAAHILRRPRASSPKLVQGSFLDEGGFVATQVAKVLGVPSVAVAHGTDVRAARGQISGIGRTRRAREAVNRASKVISVSHHLAQELALLGARAEVMPFTSMAARFPLAPPSRKGPEVLFVGRVCKAKGVERLIEALSLLAHRDATLRIVGPIVDVDPAALAARFGVADRVTIEGEVAQDGLAKLYARATCLALPSVAEGLPCVIVEALLVGRPVVASRVGGIGELVAPNLGALVDDPSPQAFARALDQVIDQRNGGLYDPDELRAAAWPYTWESVGPRLARLTRSLLVHAA